MSEDELGLTRAMAGEVKYAGRWWKCVGVVSLPGPPRERFYLLSRDGETARVSAADIDAVRAAPGKGE